MNTSSCHYQIRHPLVKEPRSNILKVAIRTHPDFDSVKLKGARCQFRKENLQIGLGLFLIARGGVIERQIINALASVAPVSCVRRLYPTHVSHVLRTT